ncbi:MAG: serine protease, partial [Gammaproteobacteria bacterium]|nr:serine protease [Gammaproteobacteria bacterium]
GNSGGPVLDESGNLVGVVQGKLDALLMIKLTGDIPQNVNFSINNYVLRAFLDAHNVPYILKESTKRLANEEIVGSTKNAVVPIDCYK